jgi:hypothetical protein
MMHNESTESNIEAVVMRRVRTAHFMRPFTGGSLLAFAVFAFALWALGREVWVARVFSNGPQDLLGHAQYLAYAFEHTRVAVQALCVAAFFAMLWFFRDLFRLVSVSFSARRA